ncbi:flagellar hook-length control protein FliK [Siminovitchia sediminis]|uniref:Flagellar hook-length control protein FliK n=1 Tax=Siminovitchia sediminis TaxID=1274353 RepID=A0ABW4KDL0_9BACI
MRIISWESPLPAAIIPVPNSKAGDADGSFGSFLNQKLAVYHSIQAVNESGSADTAAESQSNLQVLEKALALLKEIQKALFPPSNTREKEVLSDTAFLYEQLNKTDLEMASSDWEESLTLFIAAAHVFLQQNGEELLKIHSLVKDLKAMLLDVGPLPIKREKAFPFQEQPLAEHLIRHKNPSDTSGQRAQDTAYAGKKVDIEKEQPAVFRLQTEGLKEKRVQSPLQDSGLPVHSPKDTQAHDAIIGQSGMRAAGKTEEMIMNLVENSSFERQAKEMIRQLAGILHKSHFKQALQTKSLTVRLYPEHLGSLRIELIQKDGMMLARILTSTGIAKEMLDSQLHQLRQAFIQQNVQVDKIDVTFYDGLEKYSSRNPNQDHEKQQSQQEAENSTMKEEKEEEDFSRFLEQVLFEMEV